MAPVGHRDDVSVGVALPFEMGEYDFGLRLDPPVIGLHTDALLADLGYSADDIKRLRETGSIG